MLDEEFDMFTSKFVMLPDYVIQNGEISSNLTTLRLLTFLWFITYIDLSLELIAREEIFRFRRFPASDDEFVFEEEQMSVLALVCRLSLPDNEVLLWKYGQTH